MAQQIDNKQLLTVVDRITTKLLLTDSDTVFEELLHQYLVKLLSLLAVQDESVRNKIVQGLTSVNKRVKSKSEIRLPFAALMDVYLAPNSNAFVKNFTAIYLDMGFERVVDSEKNGLFATLCEKLKKVASLASNQQQQEEQVILRFLLQLLPFVKIPIQHSKHESVPLSEYQLQLSNFKRSIYCQGTEEEEQAAMSDQVPPHVHVLLSFFRDVMLFRANYSLTAEKLDIPAGLSVQSLRRIIGNVNSGKFTTQQVATMKNSIIDITMSGVFSEARMLPILIIGMGDANESIAGRCDNLLRKVSIQNVEDAAVCLSL